MLGCHRRQLHTPVYIKSTLENLRVDSSPKIVTGMILSSKLVPLYCLCPRGLQRSAAKTFRNGLLFDVRSEHGEVMYLLSQNFLTVSFRIVLYRPETFRVSRSSNSFNPTFKKGGVQPAICMNVLGHFSRK